MQEKQGDLHDLLINYVHGREAKVAEEEDAMQWKREKQGKFFYRKKCDFWFPWYNTASDTTSRAMENTLDGKGRKKQHKAQWLLYNMSVVELSDLI